MFQGLYIGGRFHLQVNVRSRGSWTTNSAKKNSREPDVARSALHKFHWNGRLGDHLFAFHWFQLKLLFGPFVHGLGSLERRQ